jgi:hypothetical protein
MCRIEDQAQIVFSCDPGQIHDVAWSPPDVDPDDARRSWGYQFLDPLWVDVVGGRIDVAEHWCDALPLEGVGRGDECE